MRTMQSFQFSPRRALFPGDKCRLKGFRGVFRFSYASISSSGEISLTFVGGLPGRYAYKSVRPDQVKPLARGREVKP